jgi:hypothetical protein
VLLERESYFDNVSRQLGEMTLDFRSVIHAV